MENFTNILLAKFSRGSYIVFGFKFLMILLLFYKFLHDTCLSIPGVITTEVKPLNLLLEQFVPAGNDGLAGNEQFHQRMEPS